jgi:hypothetical protein
MKKIVALVCLLLCSATLLQAADAIVTTVNKTCQQYGLPFTSGPYTISGAQAPYAETTVSCGTPTLFNDGIGNVQVPNLQLFYLLSDSLDLTAAFYANSAGTGSAITSLSVQQGIPYEWDTSAGTGSLPSPTNWASLKLTAGTTAQGNPSSGTATNVHIRSSLSQ